MNISILGENKCYNVLLDLSPTRYKVIEEIISTKMDFERVRGFSSLHILILNVSNSYDID